MQVTNDVGWNPSDCTKCTKFEKDEFIDGMPACKSGRCKYFGNLTDVPQGDLRQYLVGIERFLEVVVGLVTLCPYDPNGYPSAPPSEINAYGRELDIGEEMFYNLFTYYLSTIQKNISDERKRKSKNG